MIWSIPALQDTTLYESDPYRNSGLDQVLELRKEGDSSTVDLAESRILIKFDISKLSSILSQNGISINDISASLILSSVQEYELPSSYTIQAKAVTDNWTNGTGYHYFPAGTLTNKNITDGATWFSTAGSGSTTWETISNANASYGFLYNSGSTSGGGTWYTSSIASQSFNFKTNDTVNLDVTSIVKNWHNSVYENNGFLISYKHEDITSSYTPESNIQFYSAETHTVYEPHLYISWTGSLTYSTGSLSTMRYEDDPVVYVRSFKGEYGIDKKNRILIASRPKYPRPSFTQNSTFASIKALPQNSYYQIKDAHNDKIIIPFSNSTKLNTNLSGSYFDFYTTMMYPERFYKFEIKSEFEDFTEYFSSNEFTFKVIK
jgi:hypothetical protein